MDKSIEMSPNKLVKYLKKPATEFTRADIVRYCQENGVEFINLHYCGWDGKLKSLNFVINSLEHPDSLHAIRMHVWLPKILTMFVLLTLKTCLQVRDLL